MASEKSASESDHDNPSGEPYLLNSSKFSSEQKSDFGQFRFTDRRNEDSPLRFTNDHCTVEWATPPQLAWVPVSTKAKLHSGKWSLEFHVESMQKRQIGVGFLLDWNIGPNWGFFGYLGSSSSAWSYDPSTGDIVSATESIHGHLPKFNGDSGVIGLEVDLPVNEKGKFTFIIDGIRTPTKELQNSGAVVIPAVCLLSIRQRVTIKNLVRLD